jgi:predicted GNAT family acetyltransferase
MGPEALARIAERANDTYSVTWEGEIEEVEDLGDALLRRFPEGARALGGVVERIRFEPARLTERVAAILRRTAALPGRFRWLVEHSSPPGLSEGLAAAGLSRRAEWRAMALTDLDAPLPESPDVHVEELRADNAEGYVLFRSSIERDERRKGRWAEVLRRYLARPRRDVSIHFATLRGRVAGFATMRVEEGGVMYLRDAFTSPELRGQGVCSKLVAHQVRAARELGCRIAVVQANCRTLAPILARRGFVSVGAQVAYETP